MTSVFSVVSFLLLAINLSNILAQNQTSTKPPVEKESLKNYIVRIEQRVQSLKTRLLSDCDKLVEVERTRQCYHEIERLNGMSESLKSATNTSAVEQVEKALPKIEEFLVQAENVTRSSTNAPTTLSEEKEEVKNHIARTEQRVKSLRVRLLIDCDKLIERPALEKECYHELAGLNDLFEELNKAKYMDEVERVEKEVTRIGQALDQIEKDISFSFF